MRPRDRSLAQQFTEGLRSIDRTVHSLPGIKVPQHREALIEQLLESVHRVRYISVILTRKISPLRADPSSDYFDPLKAAILKIRNGEIEEAFWLVFLSVHFGKHRRTGWRRVRDVYSGLTGKVRWDWARTSIAPAAFRRWLGAHQNGIGGHFGNHRKYESLSAVSRRGTGVVMESYIRWVCPPRTHQMLAQAALEQSNADSRKAFDHLYCSMDDVIAFGRTAKFDYLTMVGKLGLAQIEPGIPYLDGSTGPLRGARLLFGGSRTANINVHTLDKWLTEVGITLNVGMQVLEDALCNWQKSPGKFIPFRG